MNHQFDMALRLAKEGRTEGFQFLYNNTCSVQICQAMNITGDLKRAQVAVQQAYQQVFDGIQNVTQAEMFEPWLCDMVTYFAIDAVREQSQSLFMESENMTFTLSDDEEDILITEPIGMDEISSAFSPEDVNTIATMLLSELTEEEKICVLMHYQNNRSVEQIAQTIGCSENAANYFISSAKKKILERTKLMKESDVRIKWKAIPFLLSILQVQASNLIASGCIGTAATFQIAGASVAMGAPAVAIGTSAGMSLAGGVAMETGVAGSAVMGSGAAGGVAMEAGVAGGAVMGSGAAGSATIGTGAASGAAGAVSAGSAAGAVSAGSAIGHGFLGTLAGKITAGIVAAAVVGSVSGGIIYHNSNKKDDTSESVTEIVEEVTEEETEKTTSVTTTEEATTEQPVDETYKRVYLSVLKDHETTIKRYNQHRDAPDGSQTNLLPAPIAVQDIVGDETPELLYMDDTVDDGVVEGDLHIYTIENGKAKEIFVNTYFDQEIAGSGEEYCLFKVKNENNLYAIKSSGDERHTTAMLRFESKADGTYAFNESISQSVGPNADYTGTYTESKIQGEVVSENEYEQKLNEIANNVETLLMYDFIPYNAIGNALPNAQQGYMTYDEAIDFLGGGEQLQEVQDTQEDQAGALPFSEPQELRYWTDPRSGTSLTIKPDGSFEGVFSGIASASPEGYESIFHGTFTNIQKKNDYTYTMELGTLVYDTPQQEWTEDMMGTQFTYTAVEAGGIYDGKTFELYLPGAPVSSLPGDYVTGLKNMYQLSEESELPAYGLYNLEGNHAFLTE